MKLIDRIRAFFDGLKDLFRKKPKKPPAETGTEIIQFARAAASGKITFETHGIVDQRERNGDGGWEYILFQAAGDNIKRFLIYHCGGGTRIGRVYFMGANPAYKVKEVNAWNDDLPGWHAWEIHWGDGMADIRIDGKSVKKCPAAFFGKIDKVWIGGCSDGRRRFKGTWRNLVIELDGEVLVR